MDFISGAILAVRASIFIAMCGAFSATIMSELILLRDAKIYLVKTYSIIHNKYQTNIFGILLPIR